MSSIKEYNVKLKSLNNTCKITKTMKMVSASKLRKAHENKHLALFQMCPGFSSRPRGFNRRMPGPH